MLLFFISPPALQAMDGLKAGAEVLTSYFQVSWGLEDRQERLEEEYGFACRRGGVGWARRRTDLEGSARAWEAAFFCAFG